MAMVNGLKIKCVKHCFLLFIYIQYGQTPLHDAALVGHSEVVTKLLDSGADVDIKDKVRKGFVME